VLAALFNSFIFRVSINLCFGKSLDNPCSSGLSTEVADEQWGRGNIFQVFQEREEPWLRKTIGEAAMLSITLVCLE
jgi:hypothetical protein